jgi:hypothetical protein
MLAFQSYNIKSPLNGRAARWVDEHRDRLPIDPQEFFVDLSHEHEHEHEHGHGLGPAAAGAAACANCGVTGAPLTACGAGHASCADCAPRCPTCTRPLCLCCGEQACATCAGSADARSAGAIM